MSWWYYLTISSSATPFFCLPSFPISGPFPKRQLCLSGGQSMGASASATVLPMSIQGWFPFWFDLLDVQGTLKRLPQHHNLKALILQLSAFFMVQLSYLYTTTGKNYSFDYTDLCWQSDLFAFYTTLSSFVIAFLPRRLLISKLQSSSIVILV